MDDWGIFSYRSNTSVMNLLCIRNKFWFNSNALVHICLRWITSYLINEVKIMFHSKYRKNKILIPKNFYRHKSCMSFTYMYLRSLIFHYYICYIIYLTNMFLYFSNQIRLFLLAYSLFHTSMNKNNLRMV